MNRHVIIVAGGKGLRMGGDIPKQFLPVGGKPVLMRTIEAFYAFDSSIHIILVLPVSQRAYWKDLCETHHFALRHDIADGGETRFHSVKNGLAYVRGEGLVGVHDGVRPFVSREVIAGCYEAAHLSYLYRYLNSQLPQTYCCPDSNKSPYKSPPILRC